MNKKRRLLSSILLLLFVTIPLTLFVSQQSQDLRQRAAIQKVEDELPPITEREVGKLIVKYKNTESESVTTENIAKEVNLQVKKKLENLETEVISVKPGKEAETIVELRSDPDVAYIEPEVFYTVDFIPNDPEWSKQYSLPKIVAPNAWDKTRGNGVRVAILDSGIDLDHPDLASKIVTGQNFTSSSSSTDVHGHGTHVAGIVAAITGNGIGTAGGCPGCELMNGKVLADDGRGTCSSIAQGITWAADNGAKVITMSLGSDNSCQTYKDAIDYAWNKGVLLVATAGNNGDQTPRYPAYYDNVIGVASTDSNDAKAGSSSYGTWVDVAAPGVSIYSTIPDGYGFKSGTSMAAPLVSAVAALIWSTPYGTSNIAVRNQLQSTADAISGTGTYWKYGRINADRAVAYNSPTPTPTRVPTPTPTRILTPTSTRPQPTPTTIPGGTNLSFSLMLHGIGRSGDSVNTASLGNLTPRTTTRTVTIEIFNNQDVRVLQKNITVSYNASTSTFTGTIDLGSTFPAGSYIIKVKTPTYLRKTIPGIHTIQTGTTKTLPLVTLIAGDTNDDNRINVIDYTLIVGCYSDLQPPKSCDSTKAKQTDLTDDGQVNQLDYNLFLREMSVQSGD